MAQKMPPIGWHRCGNRGKHGFRCPDSWRPHRAFLRLLCALQLLFVFSCRAAEPPISPDEGRPHVRWEQASSVVGMTAFVSGKVVRVGHSTRVHFLDFARNDRSAFKLVIYDDAISKFPGTLESLYENQLVEVRGTITLYAGNPQIVVTAPEQIRVLTELPPVILPVETRTPTGTTVRIATFNVRNLFDELDDPYRNDEGTPAKSRTELNRLADVFRSVNADIVALQEVESRGYLERFLQALIPDLGYRHVVHFEGNDERGIDVCLISRIAVGAVTSQRHRQFPGPEATPMVFYRDLLQVTVEPEGASPFEVWTLHLKSKSGGAEAAEPYRLAEARMVRRLLDERLNREPDARIIVCGDFNDTLGSPALRAIIGVEPHALRNFVQDIPEADRVTYNEQPYRDMIDFVLCSPAMATRYVANSYRIHLGSLESHGSDHNPVFADFRTRNEP